MAPNSIQRTLENSIQSDVRKKLILLYGPRQSGKTTLSRRLLPKAVYLNFDADQDRLRLLKQDWPKDASALIFDEIHKMKDWKRWLKGIYDTKPKHLQMLVTGSARMDIARKMGDSLAGRHFNYRLYPFDLAELASQGVMVSPRDLWTFGNFPEPFLTRDPEFYGKWRRSHTDLILRQDLLSLEPIRDFEGLETLLHLLRERVGSTLSYASLARDLHRDATTLKRWVGILERLYLIFIIRPFSKNVARAIVKEPKVYFFDSAMVLGSDAQKLENLCAFSLYKLCHFLEDSQGKSTALHFLRIKGGTEVDFLLQIEGRKPTLIEVKWSESNWSDQFRPFERTFQGANLIQVSHELNRAEVEFVGANSNRKIVRAKEWLQGLK